MRNDARGVGEFRERRPDKRGVGSAVPREVRIVCCREEVHGEVRYEVREACRQEMQARVVHTIFRKQV